MSNLEPSIDDFPRVATSPVDELLLVYSVWSRLRVPLSTDAVTTIDLLIAFFFFIIFIPGFSLLGTLNRVLAGDLLVLLAFVESKLVL